MVHVGVYKDCKRIWRVKSRNKATALKAFDLDNDEIKRIMYWMGQW